MRRLIKIRRILQDAEDQGIDPDSIVVDPGEVKALEPDDAGEAEEAEDKD